MIESIKRVCEIKTDLSVEERNLLSVAYKNKVGSHSASWRIITANEQKEEQKGETKHLRLIKVYHQKVELQQEEICNDSINVIDTYLIPQASNAEAIDFYKKNIVRALEGDISLEDLNEGMRPGQSMMFSSSSDYESSSYNNNIRRIRKMSLASPEYSGDYSGTGNDYEPHHSASSSDIGFSG